VFVRVALVGGDKDDSSNLESEDDDEEEAVGSEEDPRLFDGPAVSEERDDEDEGANCDEDVRPLLNYFRLCELPYHTLGIFIQRNSFVECAKSGQLNERIFISCQPNAHTQNS